MLSEQEEHQVAARVAAFETTTGMQLVTTLLPRCDHYPRASVESFCPRRRCRDRTKDRKLAILSNGTPEMLAAVVRHNRLDTVLDAILSVNELRIYKLAPPVCQLAVDRLGVDAHQIGFVSSNGWDASGAKSFGFRTFWINRAGAPVERLGAAPDGILASLAGLAALLD